MNERYYLKKIPVPITITKEDKIIYINEETENFTGYREEELIGRDISILYPSLYEFKTIKINAEENKGVRGLRTKLKRKNGEILDVMVHINLLKYKDGANGGIGAVLDITPIAKEEEKLQISIEKLHLFYNTLKTLTSSLNVEEITKKVVEIIREYFNIEVIAVSFVEEENDVKYSKINYYIGYDKEIIDKFLKLPLEEYKDKANLCRVIYTGTYSYIPDIKKEKKYYFEIKKDIRSSLAIPIKFKNEVLGAIVLESTEPDRFKKEDIELLITIIDMLATVIVNAQLYEKTLELSIKDALTDTYNYRYFYDQIHREIEWYKRYRIPFSLAIIDLDNFKRINDTYGHIEGDKILREIGKLLKENVRKHIDVVCRYGGDEFSIIFPRTYIKDSKMVIDRLLNLTNSYREKLYGVTMSIGLSEYKGEDPLKIIIKTDKLTYKAKQKGGNRVEIGE